MILNFSSRNPRFLDAASPKIVSNIYFFDVRFAAGGRRLVDDDSRRVMAGAFEKENHGDENDAGNGHEAEAIHEGQKIGLLNQ
jgi:hypothetical protein